MSTKHVFACLLALAAADVKLSRTFSDLAPGVSGSLKLDHGCTSMDEHGSNDCTLAWGDNATATFAYKLPAKLTYKARLDLDLKVSLVPLKASCHVCNEPCKLVVPVLGIPITIGMPDCPINTSAISTMATFSLPATSPVPVGIKVSGNVELFDDSGTSIATMNVTGDANPK